MDRFGSLRTGTSDPAGGAPLAGATRTFFEQGFGQDFGHVRLHDGPAARPATEPIGADAVTSGSHVFVRPDISVTSPGGTRLLAHELTHVVQQTGPRPLGPARKSATAERGTPGRGLRVDAAREAAADRMADRVAAGDRLSSDDLRVFGRSGGIQPSMGERVFEEMVMLLTRPGLAEDFMKRVGQVQVPGVDRARTIWQQTAQHVANAATTSFAGFMHEARAMTAIKGLLASPEPIAAAIPGIAFLAQRRVRNRTGSQPATELHPAHFANLLEGLPLRDARPRPPDPPDARSIGRGLDRHRQHRSVEGADRPCAVGPGDARLQRCDRRHPA